MSVLAGRHWVGGGSTGTSGTVFNYGLAENGRVLSRLGVWAGPRFLWGIRAWLSDDSPSQLFGSAAGVYDEFTFQDGERITLLRFWGDGVGEHTGGIRFTTNLGREFFHHMTQWSLQTAWPIDVHSGICAGVFLRSGDRIYAMGLRFLNPISGATMDNVRYPDLALQAAAIRPLSLRQFRDENHKSEPIAWRNTGSYTTVTSSSWSVTAGVAVHATVSVSAGIPTIAQVETTAGWEVSTSATHATSFEKSESTSWERSGNIPPGTWLNFEVTTRRGDISLLYEANITIFFRNGARLIYPVAGLYDGVAYTRIDKITTTGSLDNSTIHAQIKDVLCTPETIYRAKPPAAKALPLVDEPGAQVLEPSPEEEQINRNEDKHPPMISDAGVGQATINEIYISD